MCDFCNEPIEDYDFWANKPYLMLEKQLPFFETDDDIYKVVIPSDGEGTDGYDRFLDKIRYCPYCGEELLGQRTKKTS